MAALAVVAAGYLVSCSFRPLSATVIFRLGGPGRPNPALSAMSHFAVAVSNGPADSVSGSQVQNRDRTCLKLRGLVTFPVTYAQLTSGVSITLPPSNGYKISIVGYDGVTGSPSTVGQMFSGSSGLKSFFIGEKTVDIASSTSVEITSAYSQATSTDLLLDCPLPASNVQAMIQVTDTFYLASYQAGAWSYRVPFSDLSAIYNAGFYQDASGVAHFSFVKDNSGLREFHYGTVNGAEENREMVQNIGDFLPTAVAVTEAGVPSIVYVDPGNQKLVKHREKVAGAWPIENTVLNVSTGSYSELIFRGGPTDHLMVAGLATDGTGIHVRIRSGGAWGTETNITSASTYGCNMGITKIDGAMDASGFGHLIYRCENVGPIFLGYATNRSGAWITSVIDIGNAGSMDSASLSIDPNGYQHVIAASGSSLRYTTKLASNSTSFPVATEVHAFARVPRTLAIGARSANDIYALAIMSSVNDIIPVFKTTLWSVGNPLATGLSGTHIFTPLGVR